jgi:DNA-binding MarR family transcriptional regulator
MNKEKLEAPVREGSAPRLQKERRMERPSYYTITHAKVRYDKRMPAHAKLLYGDISALCKKEGYCWASNKYLAELYGVSRGTITNWIKALESAGYIRTVAEYGEKGNIERRRIYLTEVSGTEQGGQKAEQGGQKAEQGGQKAEQGGQKTEQGGQKTEQGGQKAEQGGQKIEQGWSSFSEESSTENTTNITTTTNSSTHTRAARARGGEAEQKPEKDRSAVTRAEPEEGGGAVKAREERVGMPEHKEDPEWREAPDEARKKREKIKAKWIENYRGLYGEAPIDAGQRRLDKHIERLIGKIGAESVLTALERAKSEDFCVARGYLLKIILSENVISRLLHSGRGDAGGNEYVDFFEKYCGLAAA